LATRGDDPVKQIWDVHSPPVSTAITPPSVVHKSGDISGTVGWVGVILARKDRFSGIAMKQIEVHSALLSVLRTTAIPWEIDMNTGSSSGAPGYVQTKVVHSFWRTVVLGRG